MNWINLVNAALPIIVGIATLVIHKAIKTPNDSQRAISLSKIAEGIAAIVVIQNPNASWASMVQSVINQLKITSDETTSSNPMILERAATSALLATGARPPQLK